MDTIGKSKLENTKVFEAYLDNSKKYEISLKKVIEGNKLMFQLIILENSSKKIYCSLYDINELKKIEVLSLFSSIDEIFEQICDYIDVNEQLKIKQSLSFQMNKAILSIPINSRKFKQISFELINENSELVETLFDTINKLIKKNEEFEKRLSILEEKVFGKKENEKEKETKNENDDFKGKFENLTNTKTIPAHTSYISNIITLQNNKIGISSLDHYIKIFNKDTFEQEISIKENNCVDWLEQVKDGTLISCPRDNTIRLYEINDKSYKTINVIKENSSAWKMKELENGKLISSMSNKDIKVWIKKNNTLECEFTIPNGGESYDILEIRKNEVVALSGTNINFYDLNKRDKIYSISGLESFYLNPGLKFCKANDELLLVCGTNNIFLVDIKSYQIISKIECNYVVTLFKISKDFILSGQGNGDIKQWQINGREVKLFSYKNKGHSSNAVTSFFKLNDVILSGDQSGNIKFWKFN